jgi:hypothetical protein
MSEPSPNELSGISPQAATISRREFARRAAIVATAAAVAPNVLMSQDAAPKPAVSPDKPLAAGGLSPELQAEGELKYRWVIQTYGSRLSETQKQDVHRMIMEGQKPLAAFRAFPLNNADQPATVLKFTDAEINGSR